MDLSPALSYQVIGYIKYNLEFAGLNAMQAGNRRKPTALQTAFEFSAMTSQTLYPIESPLGTCFDLQSKHCSVIL